MTPVYLGVGSNVDRNANIYGGLHALAAAFPDLDVSPVYQCKACGFEGDDFYNLVVGFNTRQTVDEILALTREIEFKFGRTRKEIRFSSRTLDIDLLLYGDLISAEYGIPRSDITRYPFVLKPLADIAPDLVHPQTGQTIATMWANFIAPGHDGSIKLKGVWDDLSPP